MCPRSGFWGPGILKSHRSLCQGSPAQRGFLKVGTGEHLPKPPWIGNHPFVGCFSTGVWGTHGLHHGCSWFSLFSSSPPISEAQSWRKRNMTHQCSHERAPASAHASAHASVHESAHESWLSLCYNPMQRLPLECSRECSRGCSRKCTRSGLVVCHLVCFHLLCSLPN